MQAVNLFTAVLALLGGVGCLPHSSSINGTRVLVLLFRNVNAFVILIWRLISGFHLMLLGYLVYRLGF